MSTPWFKIFLSIQACCLDKSNSSLTGAREQDQISRKQFLFLHAADVADHHLTPLYLSEMSVPFHSGYGLVVELFIRFVTLVIFVPFSQHGDRQNYDERGPSCCRGEWADLWDALEDGDY
jgi:hypothetical protein